MLFNHNYSSEELISLFKNGTDPNILDKHKKTIFYYRNIPEALDCALDYGLDPNIQKELFTEKTEEYGHLFKKAITKGLKVELDWFKQKFMPLYVLKAFEILPKNILHIVNFNIETLSFCLTNGINVNGLDNDGNTIFHKKKFYGDRELKFAIEKGFNVLQTNNKKETIFHTEYNPQMFLLAIKNGLDIYKKDKYGNTILHKQPKYALHLQKLEQPNLVDNYGRTILHTIMYRGICHEQHINEKEEIDYKMFHEKLDLAQILFDLGADPSIKDKFGNTFLMYWKKQDCLSQINLFSNLLQWQNIMDFLKQILTTLLVKEFIQTMIMIKKIILKMIQNTRTVRKERVVIFILTQMTLKVVHSIIIMTEIVLEM